MWKKQPQYQVGIDQSNPLTRGLIAAVNPATGIDHVTGRFINWTGGAKRTFADGAACVSTEGYGTNLYAYIDYPSRSYTQMTALAVTTPRTVSTNLSVLQFASSTDGDPIFSIRSGLTTASKMFSTVRNDIGNAATFVDTNLVAFVAGQCSVVAAEMTSAGGTIRWYINGVQDAQTSATDDAAGFTFNRLGLNCLSNLGGNEDFWDGETSLYLIWDRLLTQDEHARIAKNPWQVFAHSRRTTLFLPVSGPAAQLLAPVSDVSAGSWAPSSGSDLYAMVDETAYGDTDYIYAASATTCTLALASGSDPSSSSGHILRYRLLAGSGTVAVTLKQGTTTIASWGPHTLTGAAQDFAQTLTSGEADSITDYSALRVEFTSALA